MIERLLSGWSHATYRHPWRAAFFSIAVLVTMLVSISRLTFETDLGAAIPTRSARVLERIDRAFGVREQSFLVVETPDREEPEDLVAFAQHFESALAKDPLIADVTWGFQRLREALLEKLNPYAPRFMSPGQAEQIRDLFDTESLRRRVERQISRLSMPGLGDAEELVAADPLDLAAFLWPRLASARGAYRFDPTSAYYLSEDRRALLVRVRGTRSIDDAAAVVATTRTIDEAIDSALEATARDGGAASVLVRRGGGHYLARESAETIQRDLIVSISLSMALVLLVVARTLRSAVAGLLIVPPLLLGLVSGIGAFALVRSRIAALSLGSAALLVGLGVDFAIHLLLRGRAESARGKDAEEAMATALSEVGPGLVFAALTTAAAFLAFLFSRFAFLEDMGVLTALGILATLAATLSLLSPLARLLLRGGGAGTAPPRTLGVGAVVDLVLRAPAPVLGGMALVTLAALGYVVMEPPQLETDLQSIHARDSSALAAERRMVEIFGGSQEPVLVLAEAPDEEVLQRQLERLRPALDRLVDRGALVAHASAAMLLPDRHVEARVMESLAALDPESLRLRIDRVLSEAGFDPTALGAEVDRVVAATSDPRPLDLARLRELTLDSWLESFVRPDPDRPGAALALVTLFPERRLWSPEARERFTGMIRETLEDLEIEGSLSGLFTVSAESAGQVVSEMALIGGLALGAAALLVAFLFRRPTQIILVLTPVTLACIWTAALFDLLGYTVHFINASVLPMVIGIGIDDGIHIVHRHRRLRVTRPEAADRSAVRETFAVTGVAVALTSLTTMIAFGSLAFSVNRGLSSLGVLCLIGVSASLVASITVLPPLLWLLERGKRSGRSGEGEDT